MKRALRIQIVVLCMLLTALVPPTLAAAAADYEFQDTTPTTPILSPTAPSTAMRYPTVVGDGLNLALWYEDRSASPTVIKMRTSTTGYTGFGAATTTTGLTGLGHPRIYADGAGGFVGYFWDTSQVPPNGLKRLTSPDGVAWQDSTDISIASSPFPGEKIWGVVGYFENVTGSTDVLYFTQATGANEQLYRATATDGVSFTYTGRAFQNSGAFSTGTGVIVGSQIVFDTLQNQYTLIYTGSTPSGALGYASSSDGITFTQQEVVLPVNANHTLFKETAFLINGGLLMGFYTGTFAGVTGTSLGVYISADPPTVTSVSPAVGPTVGANSVTVTGTNLTGATAVVFGGTESTDYTIDSPTTITATVPAHATGVVDVEVSTPGGADTLVGGYTYGTAPSITSGDTTSGTAGQAMTPFTVTTTGTPTPALTKTGALPNGVTFTDNTNGTATLAGTPTETGTFPLVITAANGVAPNATQNFTVTVNQQTVAPVITSGDTTSGTAGQAMTPFTVTTTGTPTPALTKTGALPNGVTFTDNTNGTATLAGTPTETGTFPLVITAANGVAPNATQNFTVTISPQPVVPVGTSTTVTTSANPVLAGQSLLLTAAVAPATATGLVTISAGSQSLGTCTLTGGSCSLPVSSLGAGSYSVTGRYQGDTSHLTSTSPTLLQIVAQPPPPAVKPGQGLVVIGGSEIPVTTTITDHRTAVVLSGGGTTLTVGAVDDGGSRIPLAADNNLAVARGGTLRMQGTGFSPGSIATMVMLSDPQELAQVTVKHDGSFSADVTIPKVTPAGTHTVEAVGITASGDPLSAALAMTVAANERFVAQKPVRALNLPARIASKGSTRVLRLPVVTNAEQKAAVSVTCVRRQKLRGLGGPGGQACRVWRHAGAIWVGLSGAHGMKIRVLIEAPRTSMGATTYRAYRQAKVYRTHRVGVPTAHGTG